MQRFTVHFEGHVQGVGFRYTTTRLARSFDVTGFVRNLPDGRVQLVIEGKAPELNALIKKIQEVMQMNLVHTDCDQSEASGEFKRFKIR